MRLKGCEIAVVGGGVGGLAGAIALGRRGARVTVFEQAPVLTDVGAGIQVGPNGIAVLEALGVRGAAARFAAEPPAVALRDGPTGRPVVRLPLGQACVARYGRPYWQFHRADLLAVLAAGLSEAGVGLRLGTRVQRIEPLGPRVRLHLDDGTTAEAALVVAADGVRSPIRSAHFAGTRPRFTGYAAWRGLVPADRLAAGVAPEDTTVFMGPGRHLVAYPLRGGRQINVVAVERRADWVEEGWTHPDMPATVRQAFAGWAPEVEALLAGLTDTFLWGLFDHAELATWVKGRIALLGDACHPMLPFLAQGAVMALEDAWVLAARLAAADDPVQGLHAYEAERKPRATRVQRAAARSGTIYHLPSPIRGLAHLGLGAAASLSPGALIGRFDWLYGADVVGVEALT